MFGARGYDHIIPRYNFWKLEVELNIIKMLFRFMCAKYTVMYACWLTFYICNRFQQKWWHVLQVGASSRNSCTRYPKMPSCGYLLNLLRKAASCVERVLRESKLHVPSVNMYVENSRRKRCCCTFQLLKYIISAIVTCGLTLILLYSASAQYEAATDTAC